VALGLNTDMFRFFALCALIYQVIPVAILPPLPNAATQIPVFVNETSLNSSLVTWNAVSTALGVASGGVCFSYSMCVPAPESTLSGNLLIMPYTYHNSTSVATTGHDNQTNTWTCVNGSKDSGTSIWNGLCYAANTTAGVTQSYVTFGTTGVTNVASKLSQWYNVASSPFDTSGSAAGTSSTTVNAVTITAAAANELIYVHVCPVGTVQTGTVTAGSGFTLLTEGAYSTANAETCYDEYEISSGAGSITPTMTLATASTYVEQVFAFKGSASAAGTAPTGTYIERKMAWSTPLSSSTTSWPFQFTSSGNLLIARSAGGVMQLSATPPTDATNTWKLAGRVLSGGNASVGQYYVPGASANTTGGITVTTSGTGDVSFEFDSVANAAPTGGATYGWTQNEVSFSTATFNAITTYLPQATNYLLVTDGSVESDTGLSIGSPASGCVWDAGMFGNEPNPEPIYENNVWAHCYGSTIGSTQTITFTLSGATSNASQGDFAAYLTNAGIGIINFVSNQNGDAGCTFNSSTNLHCTIPAPQTGNAIIVAVGAFNSTARTITKVCLGDSADHTCATGTQLANTDFSNATTTGTSGQGASAIWDTLSGPAGAPTTLDVVTSGTVANLEFAYWEVAKGSGGGWSADTNTTSAKKQNASVASSTATGGSVTSTGAADFCAAIVTVSGGITVNPKAGNEFIYAGAGTAPLFSATGDAAASLLTTTAGAHTPTWTDASGTFNSSMACIK
jgi:hypothetical protein